MALGASRRAAARPRRRGGVRRVAARDALGGLMTLARPPWYPPYATGTAARSRRPAARRRRHVGATAAWPLRGRRRGARSSPGCTNWTRPPAAGAPSHGGGRTVVIRRLVRWFDDRLGGTRVHPQGARQGVPRPLVVHARRDRPLLLRRARAHRRLPHVLLRRRAHKTVVYHGSYRPAATACTCREAYESTVHLSFDVRAGLVMRQIHHWAALRLRRRDRRCTCAASSSPARSGGRARSTGSSA